MVFILLISSFHTVSIFLLSECTLPTDCPDEGQNYKCNSNVCECVFGFVKLGDSCVVLGKLY